MNFADIIPFRDDFEIAYDNSEGKTPHIFSWKKGVLTGYWVQDGQIKHREYSYLYLQKRNMIMQMRNFIKFRIEGRVRGIPLNGNEVYFGTEKASF